MRATKLGVGLYDSGGAYLPELDRLRPSVILLMDPKPDFAADVCGRCSRRRSSSAGYTTRTSRSTTHRSGASSSRIESRARLCLFAGYVDAWMGYNEVTGHKNFENYRAYNAFQVAFARRLQDTHGIPAMAGNDGPGAVEPDEYATYFAEAISVSKYFGIHAYSPKGETRCGRRRLTTSCSGTVASRSRSIALGSSTVRSSSPRPDCGMAGAAS